MYRVRPKQVGECRRKQDRSFYAQISYFICIKRSSLHSLNSTNSPNSLNLCKSCQTCLSRVWRVRAKWFGECRRIYRVWPKQVGKCRRMYRVRPIFQNDHFGEYSNSTNLPASGHCLVIISKVIYIVRKHFCFQIVKLSWITSQEDFDPQIRII
jgi:hypothetical protein